MAKYIILLSTCLLGCFFVGCVEKVNENLIKQDNRLVIDALITDQPGPYYVRITQGARYVGLSEDSDQYMIEKLDPAVEVTVTLMDDQGNVDVLEPHQIGDLTKGLNGRCQSDFYKLEVNQYFRTTKIQGVPGRTYTLTVIYDGQEHKATATIPATKPIIKAVNFADKPLFNFSGGGIYPFPVPQVSFDDAPNEENYYMFFVNREGHNFNTNHNAWTMLYPAFLTFDDRLMEAEVNSFDIIQVTDHEYLNSCILRPKFFYEDPYVTQRTYTVEMHSINKDAFDYYESLKEQLNSDGGGYSTAPTTAKTNFNNGALGFFRASGVAKYRLEYPLK